jgi:hypothetical protein
VRGVNEVAQDGPGRVPDGGLPDPPGPRRCGLAGRAAGRMYSTRAVRTGRPRNEDDHDRLDPLLGRATELAAADRAIPELVSVLAELADLLERHIADEERDVFPIITERVRVEDYRVMQERFRGNLGLRKVAFVAPWVAGHATAAERRALVADAGLPMRVVLRLCGPAFRARERVVFGRPAPA